MAPTSQVWLAACSDAAAAAACSVLRARGPPVRSKREPSKRALDKITTEVTANALATPSVDRSGASFCVLVNAAASPG